MARSRNIKPGFFTNAELLECQPLARLLFAGLWTEADCRGILEDRPKNLKIKVLPGDNCDTEELLQELVQAGMIVRYQVGEMRCIFVKNFGKHQNPHVNEKPNSLPAPEEYGASTVQAPEQHQCDPADSLLLIPDSLTPNSDELGEPRAPVLDFEAEKGKQSRDRKKPETPVPEGFALAESTVDWCRNKGYERKPIEAEVEQFVAYHQAKDTRMRDWQAGFRNWVLIGEKNGWARLREARNLSIA